MSIVVCALKACRLTRRDKYGRFVLASGETGIIANPRRIKLYGGHYHIRHRDGLMVVSVAQLYLFHQWSVDRVKQDTKAPRVQGGQDGGYNWPDD